MNGKKGRKGEKGERMEIHTPCLGLDNTAVLNYANTAPGEGMEERVCNSASHYQ